MAKIVLTGHLFKKNDKVYEVIGYSTDEVYLQNQETNKTGTVPFETVYNMEWLGEKEKIND